MDFLADSNVLLDIISGDPRWDAWSSAALTRCFGEGRVCINTVIFAEVSIRYNNLEEVAAALPAGDFHYEDIPGEPAFLAGKACLQYRRQGGTRATLLPDFLIDAHAAVSGPRLVTRDAKRYRTYFPTVDLISPL